MTTKDKALRVERALKLALEALTHFEKAGLATLKTVDAITAIRSVLDEHGEALAESRSDVKPWVGLTDEEINEVLGGDIRDEPSGALEFVRAIEAKLKEKNA